MSRQNRSKAADPLDLAASIRVKIAEGRTMSALKDAKDLAKRHPGPDVEDLLASAYAARITDLGRSGMHGEAAELVHVARARFPQRSELWDGAQRVTAEARGDLSLVLGRWLAEPAARDQIAAELRRAVKDPAWIADSPVLPADDPLRVAADAVRIALAEAAAGGLEEAGRTALRAIGRRSPLQPWRAFVLALDAFHRHEDERCREQLATIDDGDAVARGRDVLRAAMLDVPMPADSALAGVVTRLVAAIPAASAAAAALSDPELNDKRWFAAAKDCLRELRSVGRRPLLRFLRWVERHSDPDSALSCAADAGIGQSWLGDEFHRLIALFGGSPLDVVAGWTMWLVPKPPELRRLGDHELAFALDELEPHLERFGAMVDSALGAGTFVRWSAGARIEPSLDALGERDSDEAFGLASAWYGLHVLFPAVARRTGVEFRGGGARASLMRQIIALDASPVRCARLVGLCEAGSREWNAALELWTAAVPGDAEPWLLLALHAESTGDLQEAQVRLARAEALAPVDVRVRAAGLRLCIGRFRQHWQSGERQRCVDDLAALESRAGARGRDVRLFVLGLRERIAEDGAAVDGASLESDAGSASRALAVRSLVAHVLDGGVVGTSGETPAERLAVAAFVARIAAAVSFDLDGPPSGLDKPSTFVAADLPHDAEDLLAICELCERPALNGLRRLAAGAGLAVDGPRLARFVAHRAASLPQSLSRHRRRCVQIARHFAARLGDGEVGRVLAGIERFVDDPMSDAEATEALAIERAAVAAGPKPKSGAKRARRAHPELPFGGTLPPVDDEETSDS